MDTKLKRNNEFHHYYISSNHNKEDYFTFDTTFIGEKFTFTSCDDVFSKNELDYGSLTLVKTVIKNASLVGENFLDMCCGYGTIGILLSKFLNKKCTMVDINSTAINLAKINIIENKTIIDENEVFESNMFEKVINNFDTIVSNPPIKTGKKLLLDFGKSAYEHLNDSGSLIVVIKKNLGADSFKKYLIELFGNCEILERDKGYYVLHSKKII